MELVHVTQLLPPQFRSIFLIILPQTVLSFKATTRGLIV